MADSRINIILGAKDEASRVVGGLRGQFRNFKQDAMTGFGLGAGISVFNLGRQALGAVADAIGDVVSTAAEFDDAMTKSTAIMGDLSDAMRDDMEQAARDVAKTTTFSAKEAAEAYFFLASAGLDAAQSIKALPQVAKFAQAGNFDLAQATDLLTDAQSALGLTIRDDVIANMENMARVSDVLVKANQISNASVEQFSKSLTTKAGAALKAFNIDIEEGVAVLAAFADQGVKAEEAGNALDRILRLMTDAAIKNADAYDALGIEVFDSTGDLNNMGTIIGQITAALDGLSDRQKQVTLNQLGFKARVQGVIKPLLGTEESIRLYEDAMNDAFGTTTSVANKQLESFTAQSQLLDSAFEDLRLELAEELLPTLTDLARTLRTDVIPHFETLLDIIGILAAGPMANAAAGNIALRNSHREAADAAERHKEEMELLAISMFGSGNLQKRLQDHLDRTTAAEEEATEEAKALADAIKHVAENAFPQIKDAAEEAQKAIRKAFNTNPVRLLRREEARLEKQRRRARRQGEFDAMAIIDARLAEVRATLTASRKTREAYALEAEAQAARRKAIKAVADAHGVSEKRIRRMLKRNEGSLEAVDKKLGEVKGAVEDVPTSRQIKIETPGLAAANAGVIDLGGNIRRLPSGKQINIAVNVSRNRALAQGLFGGVLHSGIDYVPQTATYLLERGERVVPKEANRAAGGGGGGHGHDIYLNGRKVGEATDRELGRRFAYTAASADYRGTP